MSPTLGVGLISAQTQPPWAPPMSPTPGVGLKAGNPALPRRGDLDHRQQTLRGALRGDHSGLNRDPHGPSSVTAGQEFGGKDPTGTHKTSATAGLARNLDHRPPGNPTKRLEPCSTP